MSTHDKIKVSRSSLKAGEYAVVARMPECDVHKYIYRQYGIEAKYDGRTKTGQWANMCERCFKTEGVGLGIGRGQRLFLEDDIQD